MTNRILTLLIGILFCSIAVNAHEFSEESLNYKIYYKWGFIQKQAGRATLDLDSDGKYYKASLFARTESWADHFYRVRDTLLSTFSVQTLMPVEYHRIAHEKSWYGHDIVTFSYANNEVSGFCRRLSKGKKDKDVIESSHTLTAQGVTVDILSAFYYVRAIDFPNVAKGQTWKINIFSGKRKELLTISYLGIERIKLDKKSVDAYKVTFKFTSDGGKQTSDPIAAWLSTDNNHIPLRLEGKLTVGKVVCVYSELK
ncbi:MAG: DUF3108 domain-containing protein [Paramuribaculum sp.]|nr:DUF3108 domain-containing protein [Paramuribaculum sp.]